MVSLRREFHPNAKQLALINLKQYHWIDFVCSLDSLSMPLIQASSI